MDGAPPSTRVATTSSWIVRVAVDGSAPTRTQMSWWSGASGSRGPIVAPSAGGVPSGANGWVST